jgi:hypothetical protein
MGMFPGKYSHIVDTGYETISVSPNPKNFKILESEKIGKVYVSTIKYPDATNFEGVKVLVTTFDPKKKSELDPHFGENSGIIARFEPTANGLILAKYLAKAI